MAWSWRYEDARGRAVDVEEPAGELFASQGDAETWLGEHWRELRESGAAQVVLLNGEQPKYTMSLADPD
jgi:hypothetical protein